MNKEKTKKKIKNRGYIYKKETLNRKNNMQHKEIINYSKRRLYQ